MFPRKLCFMLVCRLVLTLAAAICFLLPASAHAVPLLAVSGTVTLSEPAPAGGCAIDIHLQEAGWYSQAIQTFTVPAGELSVPYDLFTESFTQGTVWYEILNDCGDHYPVGYYTGPPAPYVSYDEDKAIVLSGTSNLANMTIPLGRRVNGQVKLPSTDVAGTDIFLDVTANAVSNWFTLTDFVLIPAGGASASYSLLLPPDDLEQWVIGFEIIEGGGYKYYHTGYYVNNIPTFSPNFMTTWDYDTAQRLYSNQSYSGIDMTIFWGHTITGTVSLPAGRVAPAGGLELLMWSRQLTYYNGEDEIFVTIPEGGSSAAYTLVMPATNFNEAWEVTYNCAYYSYTKCLDEGYLEKGYYAGPSQPTFFVSQNYGLIGRENHVNIDLTLIRTKIIFGDIKLPAPAPAGGLTFDVFADDPVYPGALSGPSVSIPAGSKSASYKVHFPENSTLNWRVLYRLWESSKGYIERGYYSTSGTTHLQNQATMLNGATDHYHIDLTAIPDKDNDGIPDALDPVNNTINPGILHMLLRSKP